MSTQIVEKSGDGLSRVYGVTVPAAELSKKLSQRIAEISPQMNIKGFRPGKVPPAHVKRLYGKSIMGEVIEQTLTETTQKILDDNNLRPAGQPDLTPSSDMDKVLNGQEDLAYELAVEVMPEFEPVDPKTIKLTRPTHEPTEAEVDEALKELASSARSYEPRTGKTVKAKKDDQVKIDFVGSIDGTPFEGGSAEGFDLVLGSGQFIPGFEDQLIGAKPGDKVEVKVAFPTDYQAEHLKGKDAVFDVTVHEVKAPVETTPDDEFAKRFGMDSLDALKEALKTQLSTRYASASRFKLKRALLDVLDTKHDFPLPPRMVEAEFAGIWQQVMADKDNGGLSEEDAGKSEDDLRKEYRKIAERRVRLGLVLAELGRKHEVAVTEQELLNAMREEAMRYGPQAQQVFDMLRQNPDAQTQLRAPLYEDKVVELLFGMADVKDKAVSKDKLMEDDDLPAGYAD